MGAKNGRDKAHTQERILSAATQLFIESGYERTTVSDIAALAKVSRATVFWHFSDKGSVFRESFSRILAPFRESLARSWDDVEPDKRLEEQLAMSERFAEEHGHEIYAFVRWALESPQLSEMIVTTLLDLNQRFAGELTQTVSQLLPADEEPKLLAQSLMLAFDANLLLSIFDQRPRAIEERSASVHALARLINRDAKRGAAQSSRSRSTGSSREP
jgi:AcrR family transcriptional regulator